MSSLSHLLLVPFCLRNKTESTRIPNTKQESSREWRSSINYYNVKYVSTCAYKHRKILLSLLLTGSPLLIRILGPAKTRVSGISHN